MTNTDILILNLIAGGNNLPVLTNATGKDDRDLNFVIDRNVGVYQSCSLTWRGEHYVFGDIYKENQIAKVVGCELKKVGELPFKHKHGACANMAESRMYLCFHDLLADWKVCRVSTSPDFGDFEYTSSRYTHAKTRIAASESK